MCLLGLVLVLVGAGSSSAQKPEQQAREQMRFGAEMAQRGLWNEALFRFRRALELRPEDPSVYNNMAVAYEALGLFDDALANYRSGLRLSPDDKALKRNYARFVEFYQRHRPADSDEAAASETEVEAADTTDPPDSTDPSESPEGVRLDAL